MTSLHTYHQIPNWISGLKSCIRRGSLELILFRCECILSHGKCLDQWFRTSNSHINYVQYFLVCRSDLTGNLLWFFPRNMFWESLSFLWVGYQFISCPLLSLLGILMLTKYKMVDFLSLTDIHRTCCFIIYVSINL